MEFDESQLDLAGKHSAEKLFSLLSRLELDIKAVYLRTKGNIDSGIEQIKADMSTGDGESSEA